MRCRKIHSINVSCMRHKTDLCFCRAVTRYNNVSGCMSRDYGAPDSCSHGGARSRPAMVRS